ncbi:TIR domain-containing protein (plasmid) [Bacillus tropicus]|uniref:toll/interleukin-1 receptor domain-containing protein n=1 Tax=Bacillus tropicus TaxID=2026188 RepID=UPI0020058781|nr:TIR domain-containing protein [Bacillus tropicus]UOK49578.1 TIR domain-containing protein [Bacillus tropicus]
MSFKYDIAVSFAGEDREYVKSLVDTIINFNDQISIFYDELEQVKLWGKDLYQYLSGIYTNQAKYCIIFVSENYIKKNWTKLELQSAQARAFSQDNEYILPILLDNTKLPGLPETIGYLNSKQFSKENIAQMIIQKINLEIKNNIQITNNQKPKKPLIIRNYVYLDKNLVTNLYNQIEDDDITNESINPNRKFNNLYEILKEEGLLNSYTELNDQNWDTITNNSFLEIEGIARFSQLNQIANLSTTIMELSQTFNNPIDEEGTIAFQGFNQLNENLENNGIPLILKTNKTSKYQVLNYLNKEYIIGSQKEFEEIKLKVLCQVKKIIPKNETLKIIDISEIMKLPQENREARRKRLKDKSTLPPQAKESLKGPCIQAIPIAIYN